MNRAIQLYMAAAKYNTKQPSHALFAQAIHVAVVCSQDNVDAINSLAYCYKHGIIFRSSDSVLRRPPCLVLRSRFRTPLLRTGWLQGDGVPQDMNKAISLYHHGPCLSLLPVLSFVLTACNLILPILRAAADLGSADGQNNLAVCYHTGIHTPRTKLLHIQNETSCSAVSVERHGTSSEVLPTCSSPGLNQRWVHLNMQLV